MLVTHFKKIVAAEHARADDDALALIARAAEGSVRDGLSILDQAIAMGEGHVTALDVRNMLGLADRARIFDLAEHLFRGDTAAALSAFDALHQDGAEASQIISDLAEAVHVIARIKAVGEEPAGEALSSEEKQRGASLAGRLSMAYLSRAWQMLLKGIEETARAPHPRIAAEMVLIRLAYTSDLPTPDELIRTLGGASVPTRRAPLSEPPSEIESPRGPLNALPIHVIGSIDMDDDTDSVVDDLGLEQDALGLEDVDQVAAPTLPISSNDPRSFAEVVALVGTKRDAKLKMHLEDHVSLVKFDATAGSIDIFLLPGAPPEIANDLREKLNAWTGRRWVVVLSKSAGAPAIGDVRRAREAAELEKLKSHPAVQAVFAAFPDAKITDVRAIPSISDAASDDESKTG
ncbi:MAG: hypothetical protein CTY39_04280 [Hyphomicrobium sp.]|nr:MAG: hypothetical protein CTY39_04280 [Hyphomicrobium sp.]